MGFPWEIQWFPEKKGYLCSILFIILMDVSLINQPFWGTPILETRAKTTINIGFFMGKSWRRYGASELVNSTLLDWWCVDVLVQRILMGNSWKDWGIHEANGLFVVGGPSTNPSQMKQMAEFFSKAGNSATNRRIFSRWLLNALYCSGDFV